MKSILLTQENQTALKQQQQLLINLSMKQAFHVMQLPLLELAEWLNAEIESNPILEVDYSKESFKSSLSSKSKEPGQESQESRLSAPVSLYEHLMKQAALVFNKSVEIELAELIIGHLNEKGFLDTPLEEISSHPQLQQVLSVIQTFDPSGVGAKDTQECLLLQLKGKELAALVISKHFQDLLHNRLPLIAQKLHIPLKELVRIVQKEIAPLDLSPGYRFSPSSMTHIIPDLCLHDTEGKWEIEINTAFLPKFHVSAAYSEGLGNSQDDFYLRRQLAGGRWLKKIVHKRNHTLYRIGAFLLKKQLPFFNGETGMLVPLSMKEAAEELTLHESTIARAVANKYLACPQGTFALRSFFTQGMQKRNGDKISNQSIREMLSCIVDKEDKGSPLSDEELAQHLSKLGIPCARRTVAKYRSAMRILPAYKRRHWG